MQTDPEFLSSLTAERPFLRQLAGSLGQDGDDADDLVQVTMVNAWRHRHTYHGGNFRGWLAVCLRNNLASMTRRRWRRHEMPDPSGVYIIARPDRCGRRLDTQLACQRISEALPRLSHRARTVLIGCCIHRRSYLDLADELKCPLGTIRSTLSRARAELRRMIGEEMYSVYLDQPSDDDVLHYDVDSDSAER